MQTHDDRHDTMSELQQDEKRITNDNKENIPKSKSDSVSEDASVDLSGFQPVVKRDKKNKKVDRPPQQDEVKVNSSSQRSKRNKSKDKSDKPRKKNGDGEKSTAVKVDASPVDAETAAATPAAREDDKKIKFVEAPLPKDNPWAKAAPTTAVGDDKPAAKVAAVKTDHPKPSEKVQKVAQSKPSTVRRARHSNIHDQYSHILFFFHRFLDENCRCGRCGREKVGRVADTR